ncbi:MAG: class I SAM-dependent methyltransferase [Planctomycetes bacterium]|nr:class I SAM-dependent methyltransferase [Planctomycetota bacterium]
MGYGPEEKATLDEAKPYTMTDKRRVLALIHAVRYVVNQDIPGDIVECGVWKGGSMMVITRTLLNLKVRDRRLHLFDTFEGMSTPTKSDVSIEGHDAIRMFAETKLEDREGSEWCRSQLDDVRAAVESTGYPKDKITYVKGKVEDTLPAAAPKRIALLRLDTDWYESTLAEMDHLFTRLVPGGVLIIDDYLYWRGARQAVDEYIKREKVRIFLSPVDGGAVIGVKQS